MKGTFPANVVAGIAKAAGTKGPPDERPGDVQPGAPGAVAPPESYAIPFASQTGQIFYAPMQKRPGSKITAKTISPPYPTSSVKIATTFLPTPVQTTTFTLTMTLSTDSHAHTVCSLAYLLALHNELMKHVGFPRGTTKRRYAEVSRTVERLMEYIVKSCHAADRKV